MNRLAQLAYVVFCCLLLAISPQQSQANPVVTEGDGYIQIDKEVFGAPLRIVRPDDWNGDLVVLLHGYVFPSAPVAVPPPGQELLFEALTAGLVESGYGVAYSGYRVNGYAVREGTIDSRVAQMLFGLHFGWPDRTFLTVFSMGTHIGQRLVETTPRMYDGFLAVCAALGGSTIQNDYFSDSRVLFDYFFPGALPGDLLTTDLDFLSEAVPLIFGALASNFPAAIEMASVLELEWTTPDELIEGILFSLLGTGGGTMDMQAKAGGNPYDNSERQYSGSFDDAALNGGIGRFIANHRAANYLRRYYDPRGKLRHTEVLHLHTTRDPTVPLALHQPAYEALLERRGNQDRYFVRAIDRFGHCTFGIDEILIALEDLVEWTETGVRPVE